MTMGRACNNNVDQSVPHRSIRNHNVYTPSAPPMGLRGGVKCVKCTVDMDRHDYRLCHFTSYILHFTFYSSHRPLRQYLLFCIVQFRCLQEEPSEGRGDYNHCPPKKWCSLWITSANASRSDGMGVVSHFRAWHQWSGSSFCAQKMLCAIDIASLDKIVLFRYCAMSFRLADPRRALVVDL